MKSTQMNMDANLWDSVSNMDAEDQGQQQRGTSTGGGGGWGLGVALTKLGITSSTPSGTSSSAHGEAPPTSKSSHGNGGGGGGGGGGGRDHYTTTPASTSKAHRSAVEPQQQPKKRTSGLWTLTTGGRDDAGNHNHQYHTNGQNQDNDTNESSFWNNLKNTDHYEAESNRHIRTSDDGDESDYDTDAELDTWQRRGRPRMLNDATAQPRQPQDTPITAPTDESLNLVTKKIPKQETSPVPLYQNASVDKNEHDSSDADSELNPDDDEDAEQAGSGAKFGLGAFLTMGKEAALEEELKAYMNPDPDDKSIAELSLVSGSITPAEQKRLLLQRMDMSLGKSVQTMSLNPTEVATKELRPWRQDKHLRRGSALGAMPPGTMTMLAALGNADSDGDESENDSLLYTVPVEFERSLDRHIPKGNFDDMWKDGAATVCTMDFKGHGSNDEDEDFDHAIIAEKVKEKLDAEDRTSLFPDDNDDLFTVAQQKLKEEIEQLSKKGQCLDQKLLSPASIKRSARGTKKSSTIDSEGGKLKQSRRKSDDRASSRVASTNIKDVREENSRQKVDRTSDSGELRRKSSRPTSRMPDSHDVDDVKEPRGNSKLMDEIRTKERTRRKEPTRSRRDDGNDLALHEYKQTTEEKEVRRRKENRQEGVGKEPDSKQGQDEKERRRRKSIEGPSNRHATERGEDKKGSSTNRGSEKVDKEERIRTHASTDANARDGRKKSASKSSDGPLLDDSGRKKSASKSGDGPLLEDSRTRKSELKPWRTPKSEKSSTGNHDEVTDRHENTALAALEGRSRAAATESLSNAKGTKNSSLNRKSDGTGESSASSLNASRNHGLDMRRNNSLAVSTKSDISKQGTSSTGTGTTAETGGSYGFDDLDAAEGPGKPKRKGFFSSLVLKKANVSKDTDVTDEVLMQSRPARRRSLGSFGEGKKSKPVRRHDSDEKIGLLGTTRRKHDTEASTPLTAGLLTMTPRSLDGWGSIDDDDDYIEQPKRERRRRSTSVPKSSIDAVSGDAQRKSKSSQRVVTSDGEAEKRRKKTLSSSRHRGVDDKGPSSKHRTDILSSSTREPRSSAGADFPRVRSSRRSSTSVDDSPRVSISRRSSRSAEGSPAVSTSRQSSRPTENQHRTSSKSRRPSSTTGDDLPRVRSKNPMRESAVVVNEDHAHRKRIARSEPH